MSHAVQNEIYRAIADPTRRAIIDMLAHSERSVKEITAAFRMSQPAVSQHLRELRSARLVLATRVYRENRYRLTAAPLRPVLAWVERYRHFIDPAGHHWAIGPVSPNRSQRKPRQQK